MFQARHLPRPLIFAPRLTLRGVGSDQFEDATRRRPCEGRSSFGNAAPTVMEKLPSGCACCRHHLWSMRAPAGLDVGLVGEGFIAIGWRSFRASTAR
jgi:hypothetical protein